MRPSYLHSLIDLRAHVDDAHGDLSSDLREHLVDAIHASDHPAWGDDWADWLNAHRDEHVEVALELATDRGDADAYLPAPIPWPLTAARAGEGDW